MSVGHNLRKLRSKSKKSQQEIADLLEIDRRTYINWENEENDVKSEYIPKLAKIFDVEIKDLFSDSKSNIQINQENKENKDNSINGVVFVLTDKESVNKLAEILKINLEKRQFHKKPFQKSQTLKGFYVNFDKVGFKIGHCFQPNLQFFD